MAAQTISSEKACRRRERAPPPKPAAPEVARGPQPSPKGYTVAAGGGRGPWSHPNADLGPLNPSPALTQKVSQTGPENGPSSQRAPFPIGPRAPRARQTAGVHLFALSNLTPKSKPPRSSTYMYVASMRMPAHECDHKTAQHGARGAPATAPRAGRVRQPAAAAQAAVSSRFRKTHLLSLRTDFWGEN